MPSEATSRIKGVAFREFLRWYAEQHGEAPVLAIIDGIGPDRARYFDRDREVFGILPSTWYPAPVVHELLDGLTAGMAAHERETLARDGARHVMTITLRGIYKRLMSMLVTPQLYARFANKVWSSYYDSGAFEVLIQDPHRAQTSISDWAGHHEVMCAMNVEAANAIYDAMGKRGVQTQRTDCVTWGDSVCRFITTWD